MTGAQILIDVLKDEGVDTIFGFPGGAVIDIYDALSRTDIRHVLVRHEQGAVHAADGFARASGRVGVCLVTSGPGATNTVTGIASAYMDSIPLVVLTGQVPTHLIGNDAFQEVDIVGITRPCTKHNYLVNSTEELGKTIKEAFFLAQSGRPGPVLVDIPKDVANTSIDYTPVKDVRLKSYNPTYSPNMKQLGRIISLVERSKRPVIFAGGGIILSKAAKELTEFAHKAQIPVTTSLMGLGAFPGSDPLSLGMIGMHGTYRANMCTAACDLLISVGVRFDDRVTGKTDAFAAQAKIVHIDIDPTSIRKNIPVSIPVVGDCRVSLQHLNRLIDDVELGNLKEQRKDWFAQIDQWKSTKPLAYNQEDAIKPQYVVEKLWELTKGQAIITTEVGQNQMWAAQYYYFDHCLPIKVVILNNGYLGMVRQWQELFYDRRYTCTSLDHSPDFVKLAEAFGAMGLRATKPEEVESVLSEGLASTQPVIMDFIVEKEEGVYPMVPAGAPITEMLLV